MHDPVSLGRVRHTPHTQHIVTGVPWFSEHFPSSSTRTSPVFCIDDREHHFVTKNLVASPVPPGHSTKASSGCSLSNFTPQILTAGGIRRQPFPVLGFRRTDLAQVQHFARCRRSSRCS